MITPDLPLAQAIAAAVLDQIEQDRSINRENITVAVLGRMMLMEAKAAAAPKASGDEELAKAARELVEGLVNDPIATKASRAVCDAWSKLNRMLGDRGA